MNTWELEDAGVEREGHNFIKEDLDLLLNSESLFALKFDGPDGMELINKIKETF